MRLAALVLAGFLIGIGVGIGSNVSGLVLGAYVAVLALLIGVPLVRSRSRS